jgi:signal transduction histidine kinase/ligand-binding sensor domain-containing protein
VGFARCLCFLIAICAAPTTSAQYLFDVWNTENGLPQNSVTAVWQTHDGYLWLTTSDGLVRYDGARFTIFNKGNTEGIASNRLTVLFEDHSHALWIGTENGAAIRYKDGVFSTRQIVGSPPVNSVWSFREDAQLGLMLIARQGIARWDGERFVPYTMEDERARVVFTNSSQSISYNSRFAWSDSRGLHLFAAGRYRAYTTRDGLSNLNIVAVLEDQRANLWVVTSDNKLHRLRDERFTAVDLPGVAPAASVRAALEDHDGNVWVGAADGRLHVWRDGAWTTFGVEDNLPRRPLVALHEDREGTIWIGSFADGLFRARRRAISSISETEGLVGLGTYPALEDRDGAIWLGVWHGGVYRWQGQRLVRYTARDGLAGTVTTALYQDRQGRLLVGTNVLRQFVAGRFVPVGRDEEFTRGAIYVIHQDRSGALWVSANNGLYRIKDNSLSVLTTADGLPNNTVQAITEDRSGTLWFGTLGGLCALRDGVFRSFTERDGLASDHVRTIHEDADGTLWIGTYDGGISRFAEGRFTNYTVKNGLFSNGAFQILEDDRGGFWISCNTGIYRVSRAEMNEVAAGRRKRVTSISYGRKDGMLSVECNGGKQPAGLRARDGRLWFPTQRGVAIVDPSLIATNTQPPPVVIEETLVDGQSLAPAADGTIQLRPGQSNFEIHYTGLSFITPEQVQFRYQLAGLDADWTDAGTRRAAYYQHLPPGAYTFRVIAANRDGVWNMEGARLRVVQLPAFWQTWWFSFVVAASACALALLAYRRRIAQLKRRQAAQAAFSQQLIESQESERKRIAAELHDGLGQNLLVIKNRALLSLSAPEDRGRALEQMHEISSIASQTIDEVREIAHNLRPFQLDRLGLTKALGSIVRKLESSSDIEFAVEIDPVDELFTKEEEINLYRVVQECLNNVVRHSGATCARLSVARDGRGVVVTISDNGRGFDVTARRDGPTARAGGFGLIGISERARMLGGKEIIRSIPGEGTTVIIKIGLREHNGER